MGKKWPTTISGSWPFSMISWLSFGYHREKLIADFFDLSNNHADISLKNTNDVRL